jgi:hypothetical protein
MSVPQPSQRVPAGWYPDPYNQYAQRWWDGYRWTEHTAPAAARPGSLYNGAQDVAAGKNTAATWAFWNGIDAVIISFFVGLGWIPVVLTLGSATAGIIWGAVGLSRSKRNGIGKGFSVTGLVLGLVMLPLTLIGVLLFG